MKRQAMFPYRLSPMMTETTPSEKPRQAGGWPISVALSVGFGLLVAVAVAIVLVLALTSARDSSFALIRDKTELILTSIADAVDGHLRPAWLQSQAIAAALARGDAPLDDTARLADFLTAALSGTPQVSAMLVLTPDMQAVRAARVEGGVITQSVSLEGDVELAAAMDDIRTHDAPFWGEIVWSPDLGASLINLRAPVKRDGVFLGAVFSAITVADFSTFLTEYDDRRTANLFILYGEDKVLAHPALIGGAIPLSEDKPLPGLAEVGDPILNRTWLGPPPPLLRALEGGVKGYRVDFGDDAYAVLYRDIDRYGAVPWRIGATVAIEDLTAGLRRLITAAAGGGAVLVIAVLLALLLGRNMARPVHRLAAAAREVEDLDFDDVPVITGGGFRETREAAAAFNAMLGGLRAFSIYVPRSLVRRLVAQGDVGGLNSEEREVTVLFTDIVGFTTQAEGLSPDQIAAFLNEHFTLLTREVEAAHGTVDKYIGDSVMAFWGAPGDQPDHARLAASCALAMAAAIAADNERRRAAGETPVRIRIGIHSGPAIVGNIGSPTRVDYTLVGDTVNTASRLVDLARNYMTADDTVSILIGAPTAAALGADFAVEALGEEDIRGRQGRLALYRLTGS